MDYHGKRIRMGMDSGLDSIGWMRHLSGVAAWSPGYLGSQGGTKRIGVEIIGN